jgi:hypothetical protein
VVSPPERALEEVILVSGSVIEKLAEAFPPHPIEPAAAFEEWGGTYTDAERFRAGVRGRAWTELEGAFLEQHHDALVFFGPSSLADYLPAYVAALVRRDPSWMECLGSATSPRCWMVIGDRRSRNRRNDEGVPDQDWHRGGPAVRRECRAGGSCDDLDPSGLNRNIDNVNAKFNDLKKEKDDLEYKRNNARDDSERRDLESKIKDKKEQIELLQAKVEAWKKQLDNEKSMARDRQGRRCASLSRPRVGTAAGVEERHGRGYSSCFSSGGTRTRRLSWPSLRTRNTATCTLPLVRVTYSLPPTSMMVALASSRDARGCPTRAYRQ